MSAIVDSFLHHQTQFKAAMSRLATAVCVVTVERGAVRRGVTVSSLFSLSLTPTLVGFCLAADSRMAALLATDTTVGVSVLRSSQRGIAELYATKGGDLSNLRASRGMQLWNGAWVFPESNAWLAGVIVSVASIGDHFLFTMRVNSARSFPGAPLVYFDRSYGTAQLMTT